MKKRGSPDFILLLMTIAWVGFGMVMVYSASSAETAHLQGDPMFYTKKQLLAAAIGFVLLFTFMQIPHRLWRILYLPLFVLTLGMLVFVLVASQGTYPRSWLLLGPFSLQPAEVAKLTIVLYLAAMITKKGERFDTFRQGLLPVLLIVGLFFGLIMLQPDLGSAVVFVLCALLLVIVGGANAKHLWIGGTAITVCIGAALFGMLNGQAVGSGNYQMQRLWCYVNPWQDAKGWCWQHVQAEIAFGHGGVTGAGFGQSVQKLFYLPEAQNDFIFAIIGEEFGFIGVSLFLLAFVLYMWRGILVSLRCPDRFGSLVGIGIMGMLTIQTCINIGGVSRAIPLTGVTLPFISAGGSSLIVCMASMGIVLSISRTVSLPRAKRSSS